MDVEIHRVTLDSLALLERVSPECFDAPIVPRRAAACVASPDTILLVATVQRPEGSYVVGQLLGVLHRHPDKATELYLDDLGVDPDFRRNGIARRLIDAAQALAAKEESEATWTLAEPDIPAALATYRGLGFAEETAILFLRET